MNIDPVQILTLLAIPLLGWFLRRLVATQDQVNEKRQELLEKWLKEENTRLEKRQDNLEMEIKQIRMEYVRREDFIGSHLEVSRRLERIDHRVEGMSGQLKTIGAALTDKGVTTNTSSSSSEAER